MPSPSLTSYFFKHHMVSNLLGMPLIGINASVNHIYQEPLAQIRNVLFAMLLALTKVKFLQNIIALRYQC